VARARRSPLAGTSPLSPRKKWRAILLSTLLLVPGYWALMAGLVVVASDETTSGPPAGPFIAFGLALIPFVLVALAFLSEHPRAAAAVVRAMVLVLVVGVPVSALAADAATGLVAGLGAGGAAALRMDPVHNWRSRAIAVAAISVYVFVMLRLVPELVLLIAPALPFTALGVADHLSEGRRERERAASPSS
jgi:hypothetical protein